jgi:colicin import membrane protein
MSVNRRPTSRYEELSSSSSFPTGSRPARKQGGGSNITLVAVGALALLAVVAIFVYIQQTSTTIAAANDAVPQQGTPVKNEPPAKLRQSQQEATAAAAKQAGQAAARQAEQAAAKRVEQEAQERHRREAAAAAAQAEQTRRAAEERRAQEEQAERERQAEAARRQAAAASSEAAHPTITAADILKMELAAQAQEDERLKAIREAQRQEEEAAEEQP